MNRRRLALLLAAVVLAVTWLILDPTHEKQRGPETIRRLEEMDPQPSPADGDGRQPLQPVRPAGTADLAKLRGTGEAVRVFVTDKASTPVPRARLHVRCGAGEDNGRFVVDVVEGEAVFQRPILDEWIHVRVEDPRCADGQPLNLRPTERLNVFQEGQEIRIELREGRTLSGIVRRDDGTPAPGLRIHAAHHIQTEDGCVVTTDQEGRFALRGLPGGVLKVTVIGSPDLKVPDPVLVVHDHDAIKLVVVRLHDLRIAVLDPEGAPVAAAHVEVDWRGRRLADYASGTTTEDGTYVARNVPVAARVQVVVEPGERDPPLPTVAFAKRNAPSGKLVLRVPLGAFIRGRVLDPDGRPLAWLQVDSRRGESWCEWGTVNTDKDGRFLLGPILPGAHVLQVTPGRGGFLSPLPVEAIAPCDGIDLVCVRPVSVRGRVARDHLVAPTSVRWFREHDATREGIVHADGTFELHGVRAASGTLVVRQEGTRRGAILDDICPEEAPFEIDLAVGLEISGRLEVLPTGPQEEWRVLVHRGHYLHRPGTPVKPDGTFCTPPLPPGVYELQSRNGEDRGPPVSVRGGASDVVLPVRRE